MAFIETADRASLFVTDWGSGPPVVFTHAWGLRSDQWNYQVPALAAAGLRCVLYDRRGHGRSDRPATGYDIDTLADDLAAVIDHFGLQEATLVAHSLGSKEAVRYLTRHGGARIARLVLIAPTTPLLRRTADNPDGLDPALIEANYAAIAANVPGWCASFAAAGPYFGSSPGGSPGLIDWTIRMIVDTPLPVLLETLKVNSDADMRAELQEIQVPTLIILRVPVILSRPLTWPHSYRAREPPLVRMKATGQPCRRIEVIVRTAKPGNRRSFGGGSAHSGPLTPVGSRGRRVLSRLPVHSPG